MSPELYLALARYNRWMNEKLYAVASRLSDEERRRDRGAFFKSIHGTLDHLLVADRIWMGRFEGAELQGASLDQELYPDFEELQRERARTDHDIESWVSALRGEELAAPLRYSRRGVTHENPLWWSLSHFFNHQTHHRGQVTTLLMQAGHDPGVTDLIAMLREEAAGAPPTAPSV